MKKVIILFLLISFCGGSSESTSTQPQQDQELSQEEVIEKSSQESSRPILMNNLVIQSRIRNQSQSSGLTIQTLPDIKEFITNKSDRFFVDFEDIIAGHPYVGKRHQGHIMMHKFIFQIQIQDGERQQNPPIFHQSTQ